jgi:hypothetical protein
MREQSFEVAVLGSEKTSRHTAAASPKAGQTWSAHLLDDVGAHGRRRAAVGLYTYDGVPLPNAHLVAELMKRLHILLPAFRQEIVAPYRGSELQSQWHACSRDGCGSSTIGQRSYPGFVLVPSGDGRDVIDGVSRCTMSGQLLADGQRQGDHACSGALSVWAHKNPVGSWLLEGLRWSRAGVLHFVYDVEPVSLFRFSWQRKPPAAQRHA